MKIVIRIATLLLLVTACQAPPPQQEEGPARYTTDAPEINTAKAGMDAYLAADWDAFRAIYADDAEIFHNSNEPVDPDELLANFKEGVQNFTSYGMADEQFWERIIDDEGETWVYFWSTWKGVHAATEKSLEIPVHLAWLYKDGKVIEEYGLWDNSQIVLAEQEAQSTSE
jgi:ketosteroid isomerase-like protein